MVFGESSACAKSGAECGPGGSSSFPVAAGQADGAHAAAWRAQVVRCSTYEEFMSLVDDIERDVVACEAALAAGESVPAHPLEA